jgi:hypothetical protein
MGRGHLLQFGNSRSPFALAFVSTFYAALGFATQAPLSLAIKFSSELSEDV